ncbi:titin-like [Belonocnema kinseyi]|uniref:titin-like n=1 Tax=Belonocnema kinseyi TaxID=2817044 RepID=UPI00143D03DD|nr:titin-like [Belonocnema kinseyi]
MKKLILTLQFFAFVFLNIVQSRVLQQGHVIQRFRHQYPQKKYLNPQKGYPIPQNVHPIPQKEYLTKQKGHLIPKKGLLILQKGHTIPQKAPPTPHVAPPTPQVAPLIPQKGPLIPQKAPPIPQKGPPPIPQAAAPPHKGPGVKKVDIKGHKYRIDQHGRVKPIIGDTMLHTHDFTLLCTFIWKTHKPPRHICSHEGKVVHPEFGNILTHAGKFVGFFDLKHPGFYPIHPVK